MLRPLWKPVLCCKKEGYKCACIFFKAGGQLVPSPEAIKALAQFLSSIDFHSVPDLLATTVSFVHGSQACFTDAQVEALPSDSQSMQTLCISEHVYSQTNPALFRVQMPSVAALSNLTKLHLTMWVQPDFCPLAQLTKIEDLALQCYDSSSDCSHVIDSCKHGLQRLIIARSSWTDSTYAAAANVEAHSCCQGGDTDGGRSSSGCKPCASRLCPSVDQPLRSDVPTSFSAPVIWSGKNHGS